METARKLRAQIMTIHRKNDLYTDVLTGVGGGISVQSRSGRLMRKTHFTGITIPFM